MYRSDISEVYQAKPLASDLAMTSSESSAATKVKQSVMSIVRRASTAEFDRRLQVAQRFVGFEAKTFKTAVSS